ncbi:superoxide dismutase [Wukongibacter sp. M2B1]|uniref:superoxide dismutase n=1 Tax=Wukongibacter sp. M2B1 TaxID=3088895 RepID=UPI003D79750D
MNTIKAKDFDFRSVKGISMNQLTQHYKLYEGYVKKINEIWGILEKREDFPNPNTTYSSMRSLKLGESYALDGVKLHQLYFENLGGDSTRPYGPILDLIERDYGSYSNFEDRFKDVGLSMRGWAVLAIDPIDNRLHIYGQDSHDQGVVWNAFPLLVLDVYEHAYMIDFGIDRSRYIDVFMKNINFDVVNTRLALYNILMNTLPTMNFMPRYYPIFM